jgi:hypothetical protein
MDYKPRPGDYGYRRKRNIQLRHDWRENYSGSTGINWSKVEEPILSEYNDEIEYEETYDRDYELEGNNFGDAMEESNENNSISNIETLKAKFQSAEMEKLTIYLDKSMIDILKILKKEKRISSYSICIKRALELYLST